MIRTFICLCLFFCNSLIAEIQLKEKLAEAHPGSFLVIEQDKNFTFFYIRERLENAVIIEEVSIPAASFKRRPMNWKEWFESGARGHTAWIMSQVNLDTGVFEETFSFTHQGWIDMSEANPFFTTLLNLHFQEVPLENRRRIGLPPGYHKADNRLIWHPRLIVNGCIVKNIAFCAYKTRWPSDGSELSRKIIEIYLPIVPQENVDNVWFPAYFPYWLEVDGKIGSAKVRVVDSGLDAHSPQSPLPRRSV